MLGFIRVAPLGLEPRHTVPKTAVLPIRRWGNLPDSGMQIYRLSWNLKISLRQLQLKIRRLLRAAAGYPISPCAQARNAGPKTNKPTPTAAKVAKSTPPAAMSLALAMPPLGRGCTTSARVSSAEFRYSAASTPPMAKTTKAVSAAGMFSHHAAASARRAAAK